VLFTLEVLPAAEGDCLLLHWGARIMALIDGGPARTYAETLRPRLEVIRERLGLETLELALVMVSHVDNDHIVGVRKLFFDLRDEHVREAPESDRPFRVGRLWHNTFSDLLGVPEGLALQGADGVAALQAALAAVPPDQAVEEEGLDLALVLAGHSEGRALRDAYKILLDANRVTRLNSPFRADQSGLITTDSVAVPGAIAGLGFKIIGPRRADVLKLKTDFDRFLVEKGLDAAAALAAVAAAKDNSPTNLSSIVCLFEFGGKRVLLTGDALGEKIVEGCADAGLLSDGGLQVEILKVPHHGSARNVSRDFFKTVTANSYVFSGDGKHGNPDRTTIEWLVESRARDAFFEMVFTYPVAEIDERRRRHHKHEWRPEHDAIGAYLKAQASAGAAFTWSEGARTLDLGDELVTW
jgi:hypothetical protein